MNRIYRDPKVGGAGFRVKRHVLCSNDHTGALYHMDSTAEYEIYGK